MITGTLSSYKTDVRIGYRLILRTAEMNKRQRLGCGDSCLHSKSQEECLDILFKGVHNRVSGPCARSGKTGVAHSSRAAGAECTVESGNAWCGRDGTLEKMERVARDSGVHRQQETACGSSWRRFVTKLEAETEERWCHAVHHELEHCWRE